MGIGDQWGWAMSFGKVEMRPDGRRFGRRETNFTGWIRIPGWSSRVCVVRNVSIGGALLECEHPFTLPYTFELHIPIAGMTYVCESRHRLANSIGVEFISASQSDAVPRRREPREEVHRASSTAERRPVRSVKRAVAALKAMPSGPR